MTLHVIRSQRLEQLFERFCDRLVAGSAGSASASSDPALALAPVPIVVGSRGMAQWLRQQLARATGVAAAIDVMLPRAAFRRLDAEVGLVSAAGGDVANAIAVGAIADDDEDPFAPERLALPVVGWLRELRHDADFAKPWAYIAPAGGFDPAGPVSARELQFGCDVADVLDRLMQQRAADAVAWAADPDQAPTEHRWLARLLGRVQALASDLGTQTPAERHVDVVAPCPGHGAPGGSLPTWHVFGLSTLSLAEFQRLRAHARHRDIWLYLPTPSAAWWQDLRTKGERGPATAEGRGVDDQHERDNPVLVAFGRPSREVQAWLAAADDGGRGGVVCDEPGETAPLAAGEVASTLRRIQVWIDQAGEREEIAGLVPDQSLEFHAAAGAMRQVEALRERLLALFAADPSVSARDVLVMTPDVATFAPLVAAVFARTGEASATGDGASVSAQRLPVQIADMGLDQTNPLAAVMLALLDLAAGRLSAAALCGFAALPAVRKRFDIDDETLATMNALAIDSGMRWGLDEDDRRAAHQPAEFEHTLRFGLERLALGAVWPDGALADDEVLDCAAGAGPIAAPADVAEPAGPVLLDRRMGLRPRALRTPVELRAFGLLAQLAQDVACARAALATPRPPQAWRDDLLAAVDTFGKVSDRAAWLREALRDGMHPALQAAGGDGAGGAATIGVLQLELGAVRALLQGAFATPSRGERVFGGAVTLCALEPMRTVPFRVICLLGVDDETFPRAAHQPGWSPLAQRREGERDRRLADRHLLLETLLAARERLWVFFSGIDGRTGKAELAAAVPIEELLDVVVAASAPHDAAGERERPRARGDWLHLWPLQPWSPSRKVLEEQTATPAARQRGAQAVRALPWYDASMGGAARALLRRWRDPTQPSAPRGLALAWHPDLPLRPSHPVPATLTARELAEALTRPERVLLRRVLKVRSARDEGGLPEREAWSLEALDQWGLRDTLLREAVRARCAGGAGLADGQAQAERRRRGEGALPHGWPGRNELRSMVELANTLGDSIANKVGEGEWLGGADVPTAQVSVDGCLLVARPPLVVRAEATSTWLWTTVSTGVRDVDRMEAAISLMIALLDPELTEPPQAARMFVRDSKTDAFKEAATYQRPEASGDAARSWEEGARDWLASVALPTWQRAHLQPVPLWDDVSRGVALQVDQGELPTDTLVDAMVPPQDLGDEDIQLLWSDLETASATEEIASRWRQIAAALALTVWTPVVQMDPSATADKVKGSKRK